MNAMEIWIARLPHEIRSVIMDHICEETPVRIEELEQHKILPGVPAPDAPAAAPTGRENASFTISEWGVDFSSQSSQ